MDLSKLSNIFKVIVIVIIYIIIFLALRIMYKDLKGTNKTKGNERKRYALEVINISSSDTLKPGSVVMIPQQLVFGRKNNNDVILKDPYVSGNHARVYIQNGKCILEDLQSTNGTLLNGERLEGKAQLSIGDEITIGSAEFKVIG